MNTKHFMAGSLILIALFAARSSDAQAIFSEDFTGSATTHSWYFFRGACLTASSAAVGTSPGPLPGCLNVKSAYYFGENLVGGTNGVTGNTQTLPDPANQGALRFTNGYPFGNNEGGAIISATPFDATNGVQITFKSVTYRGDSGGGVGDGADGISFFMMDGSVTPSIGSQGGSLAYTCSNPGNIGGHPIIDGVTGGYIGLGIDEYGNFLNQGDNTATGFGQHGDRIGLRGAGNVSWPYLSTNYPLYYPASLTASQQQQAVAATCQSGYIWDYSNPGSPVAVTTGGSTVTGTFAGKISKNSNVITLVPSIPVNLVVGSTVTDPLGYFPPNTTVTAISTSPNTITLSNQAAHSSSTETLTYSSTTPGLVVPVLDYQAIPGGYSVLSGVNIANESAMKRGDATPIFYNLKITPAGVLSLSYSMSGAAYQAVITNQNITTYNGAMPATLLFGFAGSTGGSTNIHEIMCFKAAQAATSGSSATVNEKQSAKIQTTSQAFFAYYDPNSWTGTVTANTLIDTAGIVTVSNTANWDAACVLSGTATGAPSAGGGCATTGASGPTSAAPGTLGRVMLTWDTSNNVGIPFEWTSTAGQLNSSQEANLDALDATETSSRLFYLRGSRANEVNALGVGLYRSRTSLLGDIVDSSPTWVGPPVSPYAVTWTDRIQSGDSMVENSGTQSYVQYAGAESSRLNVVYVGANDGFLHGFRAGSTDSNGVLINNSTTPNDGQEVLAYMPGSTLLSAANTTTSTNCTNHAQTQSQVQNIHGVTPAIGSSALCVDPSLDFANPQYGHNFFVDATPGTGDLFYGGVWHTWLVGGLGVGGAAIYALDITNPGNFSEANASSLVVGEWNPSTITCASTPTACGVNLGNTFGTPQIRRLHNGQWGVIFGNGFGSASGDAGIYIMTVSVSGSGALSETFYYLSTGHAGGNGIAYVTPVDLDGDHITDYVYAGDLKGNIWRFDLTSASPSNWAVAAAPLFTAPSGQPISSQLLAIASMIGGGPQKLLIEFATGQRTQVTNTTPVSFASGTQAIYGVWDWNMSAWNAMSGTQYASLAATAAATGLSSPYTIPAPTTTASTSSLTAQTFTAVTTGSGSSTAATGVIEGTNVTVCWQGSTTCSTGNNKFGWYANLVGTGEQVIFNPVYFSGAIFVDSLVPATNVPTSCASVLDTGFTYALNVSNGGVFNNAFPTFINNQGTVANDPLAVGIESNATGSVDPVSTLEGSNNIIYETIPGKHGGQKVNLPPNTTAKRLTWVERR